MESCSKKPFPTPGDARTAMQGIERRHRAREALVAYGDPSLLDMPGLAYHVEEAEWNTALGTPAPPEGVPEPAGLGPVLSHTEFIRTLHSSPRRF